MLLLFFHNDRPTIINIPVKHLIISDVDLVSIAGAYPEYFLIERGDHSVSKFCTVQLQTQSVAVFIVVFIVKILGICWAEAASYG